MSRLFDATLNEEQLAKILRDGFAGGLVKTLAAECQNELKQLVDAQLRQMEKLLEQQIRLVVDKYSLHMVKMYQDPMGMKPVVNIVIEKKVEVKHD